MLAKDFATQGIRVKNAQGFREVKHEASSLATSEITLSAATHLKQNRPSHVEILSVQQQGSFITHNVLVTFKRKCQVLRSVPHHQINEPAFNSHTGITQTHKKILYQFYWDIM